LEEVKIKLETIEESKLEVKDDERKKMKRKAAFNDYEMDR